MTTEAKGHLKHPALPGMAYFVTTRLAKGVSPLTGERALIARQLLFEQRATYGFLLLAYVFMPDHAHLVVVPKADFSISQTMRLIKGTVARALNTLEGRSGRVWQDGFRDDIAFDLRQLNTYITYIHANPVRAGLSTKPESYRWSSANGDCQDDYERFFTEDRA
jgi:REP element-mobilizing transposase RayT